MKMKKIMGIILILTGIVVICIPIGWQLYVKYEQNKMIEDIKEQIQDNKNNPSATQTDINEVDGASEYDQIELDTEDTSETAEDETDEKVDSSLKNQNVIGLIEIDALDICFPVVEGTARANIRVAIGHIKGTAAMGEVGNCVLAGHRGGIYGEFFKNIHKLEEGDSVKVTNSNGDEYIYNVYEKFVVKPTDMSVIKTIGSESTLTLISCENSGKQRLIIRCKLEQ